MGADKVPNSDGHYWLFYATRGTKFAFRGTNYQYATAVRGGDVLGYGGILSSVPCLATPGWWAWQPATALRQEETGKSVINSAWRAGLISGQNALAPVYQRPDL